MRVTMALHLSIAMTFVAIFVAAVLDSLARDTTRQEKQRGAAAIVLVSLVFLTVGYWIGFIYSGYMSTPPFAWE